MTRTTTPRPALFPRRPSPTPARTDVSRALLGFAVAGAVLFAPSSGRADPNFTAGLTVGGGIAVDSPSHVVADFQLGLRGEATFLRSRDADMGFVPYVDVATRSFRSLDAGGGLGWLIPITDQVPLVISAGGFARYADMGWAPGAEARLFAGAKSHNFESSYGLTAGLFLQGRHAFGSVPANELVLGAQLDLALVAMPVILVVNALR